MKHSPLGLGVSMTRNSLLFGAIAFGLSTSSGTASSRTPLLVPSLTYGQNEPAPATPPTAQQLQSVLRQSTEDQAQVRVHTAAMVSQVQDLIDELASNGISGDDAKILQATKAVLGHLSGPEMEQVIASLKAASSAPTATDSAHQSLHAYVAQKGIILQFRVILNEYENRQALTDLQAHFKDLTDRQTDTMRTTAVVARDVMGKAAVELTTSQTTTQQIVQTDQDAIVNEVALAGKQLDSAAAATADDDAKPLQKAQADMKSGQVEQILARADDDMKSGLLMKAISEQIAARNELRRITQDLNPPADTVEAIEQTAADLAHLIDEQKQLLGETNVVIGTKAMVTGLDDQQGKLVDEATLVQQDTLALSGEAAGLIQAAINPPMQASRSQLRDLNGFPLASTSQQEAISKLEAAQKLLDKELADAREKEKADEIANAEKPKPDASDLTGALATITEAETNVGTALTDTTPPGANPSDPPAPSDSKPVADNPPTPESPDGKGPADTPPDPMTMDRALTELTEADKNVTTASNAPGLPDSTQKDIRDAKSEIEKGKDTAKNGDAPGTALHAGRAMTALIKAQTSLSLAIGGRPGSPLPGTPSPGQPGKTPSKHITPGGNDGGPLHDVASTSEKFIPPQSRDRVAVLQSSTEKRPLEYAPLIDQYLKNLSDQATPR